MECTRRLRSFNDVVGLATRLTEHGQTLRAHMRSTPSTICQLLTKGEVINHLLTIRRANRIDAPKWRISFRCWLQRVDLCLSRASGRAMADSKGHPPPHIFCA